MAKVKIVPIKCDNKPCNKNHVQKNYNTCVVQQDLLVQVAICLRELFLMDFWSLPLPEVCIRTDSMSFELGH